MIDLKTLHLIRENGLQAFAQGHILDGIATVRTLLPYCASEAVVCAEAESVEKNYHCMLSYLRGGGEDGKRNEVQNKIQRQGIALMEQASRAIRLGLHKDAYSKAFDNSNDALLHPNPSYKEKFEGGLLTPEEFSEMQDDIFDLLWTSNLWTARDTAYWYDFLLRGRDMVQQHFMGAIFLSLWEYYDDEKMQLLGILSDSECHRTRYTAIVYLLLIRIRYKELTPLMPPLPKSLLSAKGRKLVAQVQYEMLLVLVSEKDMERELKEAEELTKRIVPFLLRQKKENGGEEVPTQEDQEDMAKTLHSVISMRGRYLKNRLQRGLDINLSKLPLLHNCDYMVRIAHWFLPFDKTHPLFQSVMIDKDGNEKQNLSTMVDLILDCDVDKLAMLYLLANDKDFSNAAQKLDDQMIPKTEGAATQEYSFRYILQDLYRFFNHSPLHTQVVNPFKSEDTWLDFPDLAELFSADSHVKCCQLLFEIGRDKQVLRLIDELISRKGASASALQLKGQVLIHQQRHKEAVSCLRSAEILQPDNADILRLLTECYAAQHWFDGELECLQRLSEMFPDDDTYHRLIPMAMFKAGRNEEALKSFFKLDYEKPDDADIVQHIAMTALKLGKLDLAERYVEKGLQLSVGNKWTCYICGGHVRLIRGNWHDAMDYYEQYVSSFCQETGQDAGNALKQFDKDRGLLCQQGISAEDILLIREMLQVATEEKKC